MKGEQAWFPVTITGGHREAAFSDRPRRSSSVSVPIAARRDSALARCGTDRDGDAAPGLAPGGELRHVQDESAHGPLDPHGQLQQPFPQRGDLRGGAGGPLGLTAQLLEQHVGDGGEQDPRAGKMNCVIGYHRGVIF